MGLQTRSYTNQHVGGRWRPETHIFHLPYDECTIRLEDIILQLGLPVDGSVITRSAIVPVKWAFGICKAMLGKALNTFDSGQISTNWLKDNFEELSEDATKEVIE
ncbi:hypothetical protein PVK06_012224 [Gossypium arboreum]|uniref:Aminotransferase-like plant mobile domain-containing protein n=1 Tax=Gossypium arboreum TaxID=29729 RepID=A0ABR0QBJ6_GOSAR|nr:hypothetical protein PVK06_012224 [Gossypium arboreum]